MSNPESAIYISKVEHLKYWKPRFKRVYFGNEFCENLIPTIQELKEVLNFINRHNLKLSFLTCQTGEFCLRKFLPIFACLKIKKGDELILNDLGLFNIIKRSFKRLLPNCILGGFLVANIDPVHLLSQKFLAAQGFSSESLRRLEVNNVNTQKEFCRRKGLISQFKVSLYYPYLWFATTRFCPTSSLGGESYQNKNLHCSKMCQKYTFLAKHPTQNKGENLILKGNTWFVKRSLMKLRKDFHNFPKIDREVYMPVIPI